MREQGWIVVVEAGDVWTASLRCALRRGEFDLSPRVCRREELRIDTMDRSAALFVGIEITAQNVLASLEQLDALRRLPHAGAAALVDRHAASDPADRRELELAALEAGACLAISLPGAMDRVARAAVRSLRVTLDAQRERHTLVEQAIDHLPWQPPPWGLG